MKSQIRMLDKRIYQIDSQNQKIAGAMDYGTGIADFNQRTFREKTAVSLKNSTRGTETRVE